MNIKLQEQPHIIPQIESTDKQAELERMKFIATALLVVVSAIFVVAAIFEKQYFWVGFVRATAEAAMVGAIADWFAVTALFRHPLGLKIPHTAIIPYRKDRIGRTFGEFVQHNFLSNEVITRKLRSMNVARRAAGWIGRPENSRRVAEFAAAALTGVVQVVKDEEVQEFIERGLVAQIKSTQITPLLGHVLSLVTSTRRQQDLLRGMLKLVAHQLQENEAAVRKKINRETPWWLPRQAIEDGIYYKITTVVDETLRTVQEEPDNELNQKFETILLRFVEELKRSPELIAQGEAIKAELLQDPVVQEFSTSLWIDLKSSLLTNSANPDSDLRQSIQRGTVNFAHALQNDEAMLAKINQWVEEASVYLVREYGHEFGQLISQTISAWDADATSQKIEEQVGKDLQFIRINGTVVGGLVGLLIHTVSLLLL